jgi:organic radical activating enzyme
MNDDYIILNSENIFEEVTYFGPLRIGETRHLNIDLTYSCNMACVNCNRLSNVKNKPIANLTYAQIKNHIKDWIKNRHEFRSIMISGGEPTVHPEFLKIVSLLAKFCELKNIWIGLLTNGGKTFQALKDQIPKNVEIVNSAKTNNNPRHFKFTIAPIDFNAYDPENNPCRESLHCGRTLNKNGYFVCPSAGAIDNFLNLNLAVSGSIRETTEENLREKAKDICKYCGTYLREKNITGAFGAFKHQETSPFWENKLKL